MEGSTPEVQKKIAALEDTLKETHDWIEKVTSTLGWTKEHLFQKDEEMVSCLHDSGHRMPQAALEKHIKYCPLLQKGYTKEDVDGGQSSQFFYEKATTVVPVHIDEEIYNKILSGVSVASSAGGARREMPITLERAQSELTPAERLAIYRYCVGEAKKVHDVNVPEEELVLLDAQSAEKQGKAPLSYVETLKAMRDMKRRRQSYRAKNVHTTKKSHTQVVKEVIESQMDILSQMWRDEEREKQGRGTNEKSPASRDGSSESRSYREDSAQYRHESRRNERTVQDQNDKFRDERDKNESPKLSVVKQEKEDRYWPQSRERSRYRESYNRDRDRDRRDDYDRERDYRHRDRYRRSSPDERQYKHERRKADREKAEKSESNSDDESREKRHKKHKKKKKKKKHHSHKDRKRSRSRSRSRSASSGSGRSRSRERSPSRSQKQIERPSRGRSPSGS